MGMIGEQTGETGKERLTEGERKHLTRGGKQSDRGTDRADGERMSREGDRDRGGERRDQRRGKDRT
jgi:hypothetical protein